MKLTPRTPVAEGIELGKPSQNVAWIVLNRPGARNALTRDAGQHLTDLFTSLANDDSIHAVVFSGEGGYFSAGGDVDLIRTLPDWTREDLEARFSSSFRASSLLREMKKPVIGAFTGGVVGGAVGLALACDIRLAASDVYFMAPFSKMGLVPDYGASWLLPQAVGTAAALDLSLSGRRVQSAEAQQLGLVSRVVPDPIEDALALARDIAALPLHGLAETKRLAYLAHTTDFAAGLANEAVSQASAFLNSETRVAIEQYVGGIGARRAR